MSATGSILATATFNTADWYMGRLRQHGPVLIETHDWPKAGVKASIVSKTGRIEVRDVTLINALAELLFKTRIQLRQHVSRQPG